MAAVCQVCLKAKLLIKLQIVHFFLKLVCGLTQFWTNTVSRVKWEKLSLKCFCYYLSWNSQSRFDFPMSITTSLCLRFPWKSAIVFCAVKSFNYNNNTQTYTSFFSRVYIVLCSDCARSHLMSTRDNWKIYKLDCYSGGFSQRQVSPPQTLSPSLSLPLSLSLRKLSAIRLHININTDTSPGSSLFFLRAPQRLFIA